MKSQLKEIDDHGKIYPVLAFVCPGCIELDRGSGLHMLPVNTTVKSPSWDWDGNLEAPTLNPSILSGKGTDRICHSFLREGVFEYLNDCTHSMAGQKIEMPHLPDWFTEPGE